MTKTNLITKLTLTSILIALNIIMERFLAYSVWNLQLSFSFIIIAFASVFLGIPYAVITATVGDILGTLLFPTGPYFVGFTITNALMAFTTAIFIYKKINIYKIFSSVLINKLLFSLFLNSLWISILYRGGIKDFFIVAIPRIPTAAVTLVLEAYVIYLLFSEKSKFRKTFKKILK